MMVTFVSQCEKKSLNKTRRVLDAFANRIGNRTWQTVITNEGLIAVKKLLRKTASKNTAVSCHWIRSRSRSEFLWVVGNKDKFNAEGIVPVNYTNQLNALKMDEIIVNIKDYYANTKKQPLDQHLFAVGYVAQQIMSSLVENTNLSKLAFMAGCYHDIGKIDPAFQNWIIDKTKKKIIDELPDEGQHIDKAGKFSFEKHPRHNEISLFLYYLLKDKGDIAPQNVDSLQHAIYWHHAKPYRKLPFKKLYTVYDKLSANLNDEQLKTLFDSFKQIMSSINNLAEQYDIDSKPTTLSINLTRLNDDKEYELEEIELPKYKHYSSSDNIKNYIKNIKINARNNLIRSALITADRNVSKLSGEVLNNHIEESSLHQVFEPTNATGRELKRHIQKCLDGFNTKYPENDRNKEQNKVATQLTEVKHVGVLQGAAGCGKTKIALEWAALGNAKKIIWVCPRVQVCQGLIKDLVENEEYLPDAKIEINTGEFKTIYQSGKKEETPEDQAFSGDIVITTIDQITNAIISHRNVTTLVEYMNAHVVFDEYHEYITMPAFNLLFSELVECKKMQKDKANTLLVSATPNYHFVENLLKIDPQDVIEMPSFNKSTYKIEFQEFDEGLQDGTNPLYQQQDKNTFVISNTAITAQKSFIQNQKHENALLIHSKFKKSDKSEIFNKVFECFKKNGTKEYDVLRAGPIVQASLNISADKMITEFTHAENWLQRLGRLDRFGKNTEANIYITAVPETIAKKGTQSGSCGRFLSRLHTFQSAKAWREFLIDKDVSKELITLPQIYKLYREFYEQGSSLNAVEQDLIDALKKSVELIDAKLLDPISMPSKKKPKDGKIKIKKNSLRGDNRFVQMAVCEIGLDEQPTVINKYAYDETNDEGIEESLTASVEQIKGYGDSKQDLLAYMVKKHHNIKGGKKSYKDTFTLNEARSPDTPIFLSYTPEDLKKVETHSHPNAIYYAVGVKQVIGAISLDKLTNKE